MPKPRADQTSTVPAATWFLRAGFVALALIILLFTPYTNNLDEIKVTLQYWLGPTFVCVYLYLLARGQVRPIPRLPFFFIAGYMAVMVVSTLFSRYWWLGLRQFGFQFALVGFFLVMAGSIINKKNLHDAVWFFVLMGMATSAFGMFHYFGGFQFINNELMTSRSLQSALGQLIYTLAQTRDMLSTILNRDFFASFLVFLFPLTLSAFIVTDSNRSRVIIAVAAVMMFFCFYLGLSKDSFAAFGLSVMTYAVLYWRFCRYKRLNIPYWWVWALGFTLWAATLLLMTWSMFEPILRRMDTGVRNRGIIWGGGIGIWLESAKNFLIGAGPGHFRVLFPRHRAPDYFLHDISNVTLFAHNRYIDLLAEEGLIGFVVYMGLIAAVFYFSLLALVRCRDGDQRVYQLGILTSLIGLLFTNIFSPNVRWTVVAVTFWAIMGLGIGNYEFWRFGEWKPAARGRPIRWTPGFTALFAISCVFTLWTYYYGYVHFAGAYWNNEGIKKMQVVDELTTLPPQTRKSYLLDAIECFNRATRLNPTFLTSYYKVAHCYNQLAALEAANKAEQLKYQKQALDTYRNLQKYAFDYAEIHYNLGIVNKMIYDLTGDEQYLKASLAELIEAGRQSNKITVQFRLAEAYKDNADLPSAARTLERVLTLPLQRDPEERKRDQYYQNQAPYTLLGYYLDMKDYDNAERVAQGLLEKNPADAVAIRQLSTIYRQKGEVQRYKEFLQSILKSNPAHTFSRAELARLLEEEGDLDGAVEQLEMLVYFEPQNTAARAQLDALRSRRSS
ncbi:MAG: hypothetical protein Kow0059_21290 [Candidatus Sumerlaeia bacterium]